MGEVDLLRYLLDEAFDGRGIESTNESQSLMANLATVDVSMWRMKPERSSRTIEAIVMHVGSTKLMYADHAFGSQDLTWESLETRPWPDGEAPMPAALDWLGNAHARVLHHLERLSDDELSLPRRANWGEDRETRWLFSMLLQHDLYHAGEINHIRSLLAGEDRWRWQIYFG